MANERILVAYATRTGSTVGVAEAIGKTLSETGAQVDVRRVGEVPDLNAYQAVVLGSAIQGGVWLPEAMQFLQANRVALSQKPFAAFLVCMTLAMPRDYRQHVATWMQPVRSLVTPVSEGLFAGMLDLKKMPSIADKIKFGISVLLGVWKSGDHRDWDAIQSWTESLRPLLLVK